MSDITVRISREVPDDYKGLIVPEGKTPIRFIFEVDSEETLMEIDKMLRGCDHLVINFECKKAGKGILVSRPILRL